MRQSCTNSPKANANTKPAPASTPPSKIEDFASPYTGEALVRCKLLDKFKLLNRLYHKQIRISIIKTKSPWKHVSMIPWGDGFGGNYGYNLLRQFDKCTRVAKFAPQGAWMHLAQITAPRTGKVYPKEYWESLGYRSDKLAFVICLRLNIYRTYLPTQPK